MYVCLCVGATNQMVSDAVAAGAVTSREVAALCGAGGDCGRCRRTVRGIIADTLATTPTCAANDSLRHPALEIIPAAAR